MSGRWTGAVALILPLTDAEWVLVVSLICPEKHSGRPRIVDIREVLNAVFYLLATACFYF